ncbi:MAG: hypothetical protein XXXJIFNMEKO3_01939 [Candidatus Erwinia impunctatus]|nr:hypothetical protein XXXJIFNMEKO_01939 [Culicoides impunctatus]
MRIFIINLERSVERKTALEARCQALGLSVEFIPAIDGRQLNEEEIKNTAQAVNYAFLPGEIGCALSHQLIYKKMIRENITQALILEDDVILPDDLAELLATLPACPPQPSVRLLSRVNKYYRSPCHVTKTYAINKVYSATTAHSYIINLAAAENLLEALFPVWMTADKWMLFADYTSLRVDAVIPAPIKLAPSASDSTINAKKDDIITKKTKKEIWQKLMKKRPLIAKIREKIRRGLHPLFNKIVDQGKE